MNLKPLVFSLLACISLSSRATLPDVKVESNLAQKIDRLSLSCDENTLFTSGPTGVGVWDMNKLLFIKAMPQFKGDGLQGHSTNPNWFYCDSMLIDWTTGEILAHVNPPKKLYEANAFNGQIFRGALAMNRTEELVESHTRKILFESITTIGNSTSQFNDKEFADSVVKAIGGKPELLAKTGTRIVKLNDEGDFIIVTPDQYYKVSTGAHGSVHFVKGNEPVKLDGLELLYNRPDIILNRLGGDPKKVDALHKAWLKRLKRFGTDSTSLATINTPKVTINNIDQIPVSTSDNKINLSVTFSDSNSKLDHFNIYVNGVEQLDDTHRSIKRHNTSRHSVTIPVTIAYGKNAIEVSATNEHGVTSPKESFTVSCVKPVMSRKLYIASVGIDHYPDSTYNLAYPTKDADDFTRLFDVAHSDITEIITKKFTYSFTTASLNEIRKFFSKSSVDDIIMLFYAGHGVLDKNLDYYLSTTDMDFNEPEKQGINYDDFVATVNASPSLKRYVFIDACHSGSIDKDDVAAMTVNVPSNGNGQNPKITFRNTADLKLASKDVELTNSLLESEFTSNNDRYGATIISSASGTELAAESSLWNNGLLLYCLKEGKSLSHDDKLLADRNGDGRLTMTEWLNYAKNRASQISQGRQTPNLRSLNKQEELEILKHLK